MSVCQIANMTNHIVKVDRTNRAFRIVVPRKIIQLRRWTNVQFAIVNDDNPDFLTLRRFIDEKTLKTDD